MMSKKEYKKGMTGWVACDYTEGDCVQCTSHSDVFDAAEEASIEAKECGYEGVRWVDEKGDLYVDEQE